MTKSEAIETLRRYLPPPLLAQVLQALDPEPPSYDDMHRVEAYRREIEQGMHQDPADSTDHPERT